MSSFKCTLTIVVFIAFSYFDKIHAHFYDSCYGDLTSAGFIYTTGPMNYKVKVLGMTPAEALTTLLPEEISPKPKQEIKLKYDSVMNSKSVDKEIQAAFNARLEKECEENLTVRNYVDFLRSTVETPFSMRGPKPYCAMSYELYMDSLENMFKDKLKNLVKPEMGLVYFKIFFAELIGDGFVYSSGKLNYTNVARTNNTDNREIYGVMTVHYHYYISQRYTQNDVITLLPFTWSECAVCREELYSSGFIHPRAQENNNYVLSNLSMDDVDQFSEYGIAYSEYLTKHKESYNVSSSPGTKFENLTPFNDGHEDFLGVPMNFCMSKVCKDVLTKMGFVKDDKNVKEIVASMDEDIILNHHSDFVAGFYYYVKGLKDDETALEVNVWCEKYVVLKSDPYLIY